MGRWTQHDEDSARLFGGMKRIGYDADTRRYIFEDENGVLYQSEPDCSYGIITPVCQEGTEIQRTRPNAFESFTPGKQQKGTRAYSNLNSFNDFLPSGAITSLSSSNLRRPSILKKVKTMRTAVSQMSRSG